MLAKAGVNSENVLQNKIQLKHAFFNAKLVLKGKAVEWYKSYSEEKGIKFDEIQPDFYKATWFKKVDMRGYEVKLVNRLMVSHDCSKFWLHRMKILDDAECEVCEVPEISEHTILHCPRFGRIRMHFSFDNKFSTLVELWKKNDSDLYKEVTEFIRLAKLDL